MRPFVDALSRVLRHGALVLAAGCLVALLGGTAAEGASAADVTVERGLTYGSAPVNGSSGDRRQLKLDLYEPPAGTGSSTARRPVVVLVHGGGFVGGNRGDDRIERVARAFARKGVVAASIDYRLKGDRPVPSQRVRPLLSHIPSSTKFADRREAIVSAVDDTLTAVGWLRDQSADRRLDLGRLGLVGASAGAITVDHVAYVLDGHGIAAPKVRFVGSLWGEILVRSKNDAPNPAVQINAGEAPLFLVHGKQDHTITPADGSDRLAARTRSLGIPTEYYSVPGAGHGWEETEFFTRDVGGGDTAFNRLLQFADRML